MTVPPAFVGAWARQSIALGAAAPCEPATVIWVQGHSAYADLRVPIEEGEAVECFAGHTSWDPPYLHWGHDLDLAGGPAASTDRGAVEWVGADLVERGTFTIDGTDVPYVEVWRRLPESEGRVVETVEQGAIGVAVGSHELCVVDRRATGGPFAAEYRRGGQVVLSFGSPAEACA